MEVLDAAKTDKRKKLVKVPRNRVDKYKSLIKRKKKPFRGVRYQDIPSGSGILNEEITLTSEVVEEVTDPNVPCSTGVSVMEKKIGVPIKTSPVKMLTRKRKHDTSLLSPDDVCRPPTPQSPK